MDFENRYIDELIDAREIARMNKEWKLSDEIRDYLDTQNVFIFDTKIGQEVHFACTKTTRADYESKLREEIRLNAVFDAWLYSVSISPNPQQEAQIQSEP